MARKTFIMKDEDDFGLRRQHLIRISFGVTMNLLRADILNISSSRLSNGFVSINV